MESLKFDISAKPSNDAQDEENLPANPWSTLATILLLLFVGFSPSTAQEGPGIPIDWAGRPLIDEHGAPIHYEIPVEELVSDRFRTHFEGRGSDLKLSPRSKRRYPDTFPHYKNSFPVTLEHRDVTFGAGMGSNGLNVADLDGDGSKEIVVAAGNPLQLDQLDYWYILSWNGTEMEMVWSSFRSFLRMGNILTHDIDDDGVDEVVLSTNNQIMIYEGLEPALVRTINVGSAHIFEMNIADLDQDGDLEVVLIDANYNLLILDLATGTEIFRRSGVTLGLDGLEVGNVDHDAALEIVATSAFGTGYVIDGQSHLVEWAISSNLGHYATLVDIDGDGINEIAAGPIDRTITIYDAVNQSAIYSVPSAQNYIDAIRAFDYDGDGETEIVYGDDLRGSLHFLDPTTGIEEEAIPNPHLGVSDFAFADVDGDGDEELLWGSGHETREADFLFVWDLESAALQWRNPSDVGPFTVMEHGDIDGDGTLELLYGFKEGAESRYSTPDGEWFMVNAETRELEYHRPGFDDGFTTTYGQVRAANLDDDPQLELCFLDGSEYSQKVKCLDGLTRAVQWSAGEGFSFTYRYHAIQIADLDGDGALEVVIVGDRLYVFDGATGARKWTGEGGGKLLRIADVDGDGQKEILSAELYGALRILDGQTFATKLLTQDFDISALETVDRDGDGVEEILIGDRNGWLRWISAQTGARTTLGFISGSAPRRDVVGLRARDVNQDGVADFVFSHSYAIKIYDGSTMALLWSSGEIGGVSAGWTVPGSQDTLFVDDIDGDGRTEIWINMGFEGMITWELPDLGPLCFEDDFEDGALDGAWTLGLLGDADQGDAIVVDGALQLSGDGSSLYAGDDHGVFLYRNDINGDFRMETDLTGFPVDEGGPYRKAGLMARADMSVDSPRILINYVPNFGGSGRPVLQFRYRLAQGGVGDGALGSNIYDLPLPIRIAMERQGDTVEVFYSIDGGATWAQPKGGSQGEISLPALGNAPLVGLNVVSYDPNRATTAEIDDFSVCMP